MLHFTIFRKKRVITALNVLACIVVLLSALMARVQATPLYNVTDTQIIHTIQGTDKFYTKKQKGEIRLHLSPYFQHAGAARDNKGRRVPLGERVGKWNMSGLLFGQDAMPAGKNLANYTNLNAAHDVLRALTVNAAAPVTAPFKNLDDETLFPTEDLASTFATVDVKHEKLGLRGQLSCDFGFGLGITIKGGFVDYRERPNFGVIGSANDVFHIPAAEAGKQSLDAVKVAANPGTAVRAAEATVEPLYLLYNTLFSPDAREKLFKNINVDASEVRDTALEDTHMQLFWHFPYEMKEKGELSVTMIPGLSVGAWLPTGKIKNQDKIFSIDTGNGGFYGLTFEGSLGFDYPKMLQASFGAGALVSMSKEFKDYRVPSCTPAVGVIKQSGIYPWKTTVGRTPGVTWYANASLKAEGFSGALSFNFDYIYTYHQKDTVTLREPNGTRRNAFAPGVLMLEEESNWKTQLMNFGLDYRVNPHLSFGSALQTMIGGVRVFKTTTVLGSMTLTF